MTPTFCSCRGRTPETTICSRAVTASTHAEASEIAAANSCRRLASTTARTAAAASDPMTVTSTGWRRAKRRTARIDARATPTRRVWRIGALRHRAPSRRAGGCFYRPATRSDTCLSMGLPGESIPIIVEPLKLLDLWSEAAMVYTSLGVYAGQPLGTPCDEPR